MAVVDHLAAAGLRAVHSRNLLFISFVSRLNWYPTACPSQREYGTAGVNSPPSRSLAQILGPVFLPLAAVSIPECSLNSARGQ